jgi:hypothetical protein
MDGIIGILIFQHSLSWLAYRAFVIAILATLVIFFRRWFLLKSVPNDQEHNRRRVHTLNSIQKEQLSAKSGISTGFNQLAGYLCIIFRLVETRQPSIIVYVRIGTRTKQDLDHNSRTLLLNGNSRSNHLLPLCYHDDVRCDA